ncbi:MAG: chromate resistance protein ChrB domain-containing protein [Gemmatimonadaceae bacterium]
MTSPRWLLLIHSIPPEPAYFRVKVRRRLKRLGALALKNSVYLLPNTEDALEDLRWLAQEIRADGGEAVITAADIIDGPSVDELATRLGEAGDASPSAAPRVDATLGEMKGRRWVTRRGIKVDRMASAWLIRTRIDPEARFAFLAEGREAKKHDLRFDMFEGEFTHEGERCTFEVLLQRFTLSDDPALVALGEIVHDLDCKDERFGRPENGGVHLMIGELVQRIASDEERLTASSALFDSLYRGLASGR